MNDLDQDLEQDQGGFEKFWRDLGEEGVAGLAAREAFVSQADVRAVGHDVNRGENKKCGENGVQCGSAEVIIPTGKRVLSIERVARNSHSRPSGWTADPYNSIGWCWFERQWQRTLPDGRQVIGVELKNWSENINRQVRITVITN